MPSRSASGPPRRYSSDSMLASHSSARAANRWAVASRSASVLATRSAAAGPSTQLDRWEDAHGVTPFTLASEIAALRVASTLAERDATAHRFAARADEWDARIESLLYRRGGPLADRLGIAGYYVRARVPGEPLPAATLSPNELSPD